MGHVEKSIYFATESDHQIIINNLLILLYKFVRMKATLFKRAEIPLFLRPKLKLLMDMHIKDYSFILRFGMWEFHIFQTLLVYIFRPNAWNLFKQKH